MSWDADTFEGSWEAVRQFFVENFNWCREDYPDFSDIQFEEFKEYICAPTSSKGLIPLIDEMRHEAFHRHTRAGQSIYYLILSRSKQHGLRPGQHYVFLHPRSTRSVDIGYNDGTEEYGREEKVRLQDHPYHMSDDLRRLLNELLQQPID